MKSLVTLYESLKLEFFSITIKPAAAFRHTALEKSLSSPLKISIILLALKLASSPIKFSNFSAFILSSFGLINNSDILPFFN